jgi:hypothetical protein
MKVFIFVASVGLLTYAIPAQTSSLLDNRFFSCKAANEAGISSVPTPRFYVPAGWSHTSDRDGDGVSCEPKPRR